MSAAGIRVNGEARGLSAATLEELLRQESIDPDARGLAVAVNGRLARRRDWAAFALKPGDAVEIVKPFAGG